MRHRLLALCCVIAACSEQPPKVDVATASTYATKPVPVATTALPTKTDPVGLDHIQLVAHIEFEPGDDGRQKEMRTFVRWKDDRHPSAGFLPATPSAKVPDPGARFFSEVVQGTLVECFYASLDAIDLEPKLIMASVYCIQTHHTDGGGAGVFVESGVSCTAVPGEHGGGSRVHLTQFDEQRTVRSGSFMFALGCNVLDGPGVPPDTRVRAPSAATAPQTATSAPARERAPAPTPRPVPTGSRSDGGLVVTAANDETFVIETQLGRKVFEAKTYCFGIAEGDHVVFVASPSICIANKFIHKRSGNVCEVWCK